MRYLKSSLQDLREIFENRIQVKHIAEPLTSFDGHVSAAQIRAFMESSDYDVIGVRDEGLVTGYVNRNDLSIGSLHKYERSFDGEILLPETASIAEAFKSLRSTPQVFVTAFGAVGGIVTPGDLQKMPIRTWLFALSSLIEMQMLRIVRDFYPEAGWGDVLKDDRIAKAEAVLQMRKGQNMAIDLADCLQLCDKRDIICKTNLLNENLGRGLDFSAKNLLKKLEKLRNDLAHGQDIIAGRWPDIVDLVSNAEIFLENCENFQMPEHSNRKTA